MAASSFEERTMWGWRTLVVSLTKKISSLRELDRLLTRRAEATQDYAKAVAKARQRVGDDIADFEESTVSDVWETVLASEEEAARTAAALAREMQESVHEQLSAAAAQMDVARKRIVAEGQLLVKQNQEALRALAKAKERFLAKSAEHEQLELSLHEAEAASATDPKKKAKLPDLEKKLARAVEELEEASATYRNAIASANARQDGYRAKMPIILADYRSCLARRSEQLREALATYAQALATSAGRDAALSPALLKSAKAIDIDKDVEELTQKCEAPPPPTHVFEPFVKGQQQQQHKGPFSLRRSASIPQPQSQQAASQQQQPATNAAKAWFRVPLETLCEREGDKVPPIVKHLIERTLELGGAHARGIFRLAGDSGDIREWTQQADATGAFLPLDDPHNCAVLLKLWLRSLPDPLVPDSLYNAATADGSAVIAFNQLPEPNKTLAGFIVSFLQYMSKEANAADTKMDAVNLASMFAPCMLRCPFEDLEKSLIFAEKEKSFVLGLIDKLDTSGFPKFKIPTHTVAAINVEASAPAVAVGSPPHASTSAAAVPPQRTLIGSTRGSSHPPVQAPGTPKSPRPSVPHKPVPLPPPPPPSAAHP